ncbi:DUF645 family protein [Clostridium tertium]
MISLGLYIIYITLSQTLRCGELSLENFTF